VESSASRAVSTLSGPWLWGREVDLAVFAVVPALAVLLAWAGSPLGLDAQVPPWAWIVCVVGVDVAHVHSTLFRTYADGAELRARPLLYAGVPFVCYALGVVLHSVSERGFWRALAYVAVAHFVRQQAGWVAVYRARAGERGWVGRVIDDAAVYLSTCVPLLAWHTRLPQPFRWFFEGDFVDLRPLAPAVGWLTGLNAVALGVYAARALWLGAQGHSNPGKHVVVLGTALAWWTGIAWAPTDWGFTLTNVLPHGAPYFALLWAYTRERGAEAPTTLVGRVAGVGVGAFFAVCLGLAFVEEGAWDRLVWHDRPELFGGDRDEPLLGAVGKALVVPLLALPQATHYVLDAVLWRRARTGPAQARALGFVGLPPDAPLLATKGEAR
jgi:hypothetical protein